MQRARCAACWLGVAAFTMSRLHYVWSPCVLGCADAARLVREVLRTVSQFHANGVVIRDVKPENFLFATDCADSHLKAIDFGIAQYCKSVPLRCLLRLPRCCDYMCMCGCVGVCAMSDVAAQMGGLATCSCAAHKHARLQCTQCQRSAGRFALACNASHHRSCLGTSSACRAA